MKNILPVPGIILILLFLLSGCASFMTYQSESTVTRIIDALNQGQVKELTEQSSAPFLLDQEIILLPKDLTLFWTNLTTRKFTITDFTIGAIKPVAKETFKQFAATMEAESFFANYVSRRAYWVTVETPAYRLLLLLDTAKGGKQVLRGWKGPDPL